MECENEQTTVVLDHWETKNWEPDPIPAQGLTAGGGGGAALLLIDSRMYKDLTVQGTKTLLSLEHHQSISCKELLMAWQVCEFFNNLHRFKLNRQLCASH